MKLRQKTSSTDALKLNFEKVLFADSALVASCPKAALVWVYSNR
jgi:hypothetical protein